MHDSVAIRWLGISCHTSCDDAPKDENKAAAISSSAWFRKAKEIYGRMSEGSKHGNQRG